MGEKIYLIITAIIFGLLSLFHLLRLIFQLPVQVGMWHIPIWLSWLGMVVASIMCLWALGIARK